MAVAGEVFQLVDAVDRNDARGALPSEVDLDQEVGAAGQDVGLALGAQAGPAAIRDVVSAAGVNYADTHQIENSYLAPQQLPMVPGAKRHGEFIADLEA